MTETTDTRPSEGFFENVRQNGVFFFFPRSGVERYWASCVEDGLQDLGIPTSSNQNLADWGKVASVIPSVDSATLVGGDISDMEFCRREEVDPIIRAVVAQPKRSLLNQYQLRGPRAYVSIAHLPRVPERSVLRMRFFPIQAANNKRGVSGPGSPAVAT
jgi:hypothetical protein